MGIFYGIANLPNLSTLALGKYLITEAIVFNTAPNNALSSSK